MRVLRRHPAQVAALTLAVGVVVVLGVMALRPSGGSRAVGGVVRPSAVATVTADPRVEVVKDVARRFIQAFWESAKTGDPEPVRALTEKGTQAEGNALVNATISKAGHNFMAERVDIDEASWQLDVLTDVASATVLYKLYGRDSDWPSLRPLEHEHETKAIQAKLDMELVGTTWLVTKSN